MVQRIEHSPPKAEIEVRFLAGAMKRCWADTRDVGSRASRSYDIALPVSAVCHEAVHGSLRLNAHREQRNDEKIKRLTLQGEPFNFSAINKVPTQPFFEARQGDPLLVGFQD